MASVRSEGSFLQHWAWSFIPKLFWLQLSTLISSETPQLDSWLLEEKHNLLSFKSQQAEQFEKFKSHLNLPWTNLHKFKSGL